jgi:hypothetical protein
MKAIFSILSATFLCCSCGQSNTSATKQTETDDPGAIISIINFKQKASKEDINAFDDGFIHWINIDNAKTELENLVDADEIVASFKVATIIIDYPLTYPTTFEIKATGQGFSRKQLISEINEKYHEIYALEESTATTKTIPLEKRNGVINRNKTNGKFGIGGHDLSDLCLSQIEVHKNIRGEITLTLVIES